MSEVREQLIAFGAILDPVEQEERRREAYQTLFGTPLGAAVLLDILIDAGVGSTFGPPSGVEGSRDYAAGHHDRATIILDLAGVDPRRAVQAITTGNEGYLYERRDDEPQL